MPDGHGLGWIPDVPDLRDRIYAPSDEDSAKALPPRHDLGTLCPPVLDQLGFRACAANAVVNAHRHEQKHQGLPGTFMPSRMFVYWNARAKVNAQGSDGGSSIRESMKAIAKLGACPEEQWPYVQANITQPPTAACFTAATAHRAIAYHRIRRSLHLLRRCIFSGHPFAFGFAMYSSFKTAAVSTGGVVPMPAKDEEFEGGHAALAVGYDDASATFRVMNSYGTGWGRQGYFDLPYGYLESEDLSDDFWTITKVDG